MLAQTVAHTDGQIRRILKYRCHHPLNSNIISWVKPVQTTLKLGLWAAAGDVGHCLSLVRRTPVCCHKAPLYAAACAMALARPEELYQ